MAAPGELVNLSNSPFVWSVRPQAATDGSTGFVVWEERDGQITFATLRDAGTTRGVTWPLNPSGSPGRDARMAVAGQSVHVVWSRPAFEEPPVGTSVMYNRSISGGALFEGVELLSAGDSRTSYGPEVAADGTDVAVVWTERDKITVARSSDSGATFAVEVGINAVPAGTIGHAVAVHAGRVSIAYAGADGAVHLARRAAAGGAWTDTAVGPGGSVLRMGAGGGAIHMLVPDGPGGPRLVTDRSGALTSTAIGDCAGSSCVAANMFVDGPTVYVALVGPVETGEGSLIYLRKASAAGTNLESAVLVARSADSAQPLVSTSGESVVVSWEENALKPDGRRDYDTYAAASGDGGATFLTVRLDDEAVAPRQSLFTAPIAFETGFATAWTDGPGNIFTHDGDFEIFYRTFIVGEADVAIDHLAFTQGVEYDKLVANRPTSVRATIRSISPMSTVVNYVMTIERMSRDGVEEQDIRTGSLRLNPGVNTRHLPSDQPFTPRRPAGGVSVRVTVEILNPDSDQSNNVKSVSAPVKPVRPFNVLFIPAGPPGAHPSCSEVEQLAAVTESYLMATFPLDPDRSEFSADCGAGEDIGQPASEARIRELFGQLDSRTSLTRWTKVVAVVPTGWFSRQAWEGKVKDAVALALSPSPFDQAVFGESHIDGVIVEKDNVGGWPAAHELAHSFGWVSPHAPAPPKDSSDPGHLLLTEAPGYWVSRGKRVELYDFMTAGDKCPPTNSLCADRTKPSRWLSGPSYDHLFERLAVSPFDPPLVSLDLVIAPGDVVTTGHWYEYEGDLDTTLGTSTTYQLEYLDAGGTVLGRAGLPVSVPPHQSSDYVSIAAKAPQVPGTTALRVVRDGQTLYERARSANPPSVRITSPAGGERFQTADEITVSWEASDADGDELEHIVGVSADGGETWTNLKTGVVGTTTTVTASPTMISDKLLFRVVTSDGLNTTVDESDAPVSVRLRMLTGSVTFQKGHAVDQSVWQVEADGSGRRTLNAGGYNYYEDTLGYDWSPTGDEIVIADQGELWAAEYEANGRRLIASLSQPDEHGVRARILAEPDWAPDGRTIAATLKTNSSFVDADEVVLVDAATGTHRVVAPAGGEPSWSPDGTRLAFVGQQPSNGGFVDKGIVTIRADGTDRRVVRATGRSPAWSPDGQWIAFAEPSSCVAIMRPDGSGERCIAPIGPLSESWSPMLDWSPDSKAIVYSERVSRAADGQITGDLWLAHLDGAALVNLTNTPTAYPCPIGFRYYDDNDCEMSELHPKWRPVPSWRRVRPVEPTLVGPATVVEGAEISYTAGPGAKPTFPVSSYAWDFDADGEFDDASGQSAAARFEDDGTMVVGVLATDDQSREGSARRSTKVLNASPVARHVHAAVDPNGAAVLTAEFTDAGVLDTHAASVDWGDGTTSDARAITTSGVVRILAAHRYASAGDRPSVVAVTIVDDDGAKTTTTTPLTAGAANAPPVASEGSLLLRQGGLAAFELLGSDPDGSLVTVEIVDGPEHGELVNGTRPGDRDATYRPDAGFSGADEFTFRLSDGRARSGLATITIAVEPWRTGSFECRAVSLRRGSEELAATDGGAGGCQADEASAVSQDGGSVAVAGLVADTELVPDDPAAARPRGGDAARSRAAAASVTITAGTTRVEARGVTASAASTCTGSPLAPALTSASSVAALTVNGVAIVVGDTAREIPLPGAVLRLNHEDRMSDRVVRRALWLDADGTDDVVVAEALAGMDAEVCAELPIAVLTGFGVEPSSVRGGQSSTGRVSLSRPTTARQVVTLTSDHSGVLPPRSVAIPAGATDTEFAIATSEARSGAVASLFAHLNGVTKTTSLQLEPPPPVLVQLDGAAGCITSWTLPGCSGSARQLGGARGLAESPDGKHVYVAATDSGAVSVFVRDPESGTLTQPAAGSGCVQQWGFDDCIETRGVVAASSVAVSPDGRHAYVASQYGSVTALSRDPGTGALARLAGSAGCIGRQFDGCRAGIGLGEPYDVAVSPDGGNVYVADYDTGSLLVFRRDADTGVLTQLDGNSGCLTSWGASGCGAVRGLGGAISLVVAPDGAHVYVASDYENAIAVFRRDPSTGALTQAAGEAGCMTSAGSTAGCAVGRGLEAVTSLALDADGAHLYTAGWSGTVSAFRVDVSTGALTQIPGELGCWQQDGTDSCSDAHGIAESVAITVSPDGTHVIVGTHTPGGLALFARDDATGRLTQLSGSAGCVEMSEGTDGCAPGTGLAGVTDVLVSTDGRFVHAVGETEGTLVSFARSVA